MGWGRAFWKSWQVNVGQANSLFKRICQFPQLLSMCGRFRAILSPRRAKAPKMRVRRIEPADGPTRREELNGNPQNL
jgi:hypothetical protein